MKNLLLILIVIFSEQFCYSQNWNLFSQNDKYNYLNLTDSTITTIWIDSVNSDKDSVFYFNPLLDYYKVYSEKHNDTILRGNLKPAVLFNQVITKVGDSLYFLGKNKEWLIKPKSTLHSSWNFSEGITANVSDCILDTVFDMPDSVKTIKTADNQTIQLSKSFGIIYWNMNASLELKLIGIEDRYGIQIPDFTDYYDFSVGDIFQYSVGNYIEMDHFPRWYDIKFTIESKKRQGDSIIYSLKGLEKLRTPTGFGEEYEYNSSTFTKESILINTECFFTNKYFNELINIKNTSVSFYPEVTDYFHSTFTDTMFYSLLVKLTKDNIVTKSFRGGRDSEYSNSFLEIKYDNADSIIYESKMTNIPYSFLEFTLKPEIGISSYDEFDGMNSQGFELKGAVINGDTIGKVNGDEFFKVSSLEQHSSQTKIYPNPFHNNVYIELKANSQIEIYDLNGRIIYSSFFDIGTKKIDLSAIEKGMYILKLTGKRATIQEIIIKN